MYRIRLHGRGGHGIKTASRILGSAFFAEGYEVQDAPRYGAERRGAPIFAYVRADPAEIHERGVIGRPDLVVVADETLVPLPAAGVLAGIGPQTVMLITSTEKPELWRERLQLDTRLLTMAPAGSEDDPLHFVGASCAGAAARLVGVISRAALESAMRSELAALGPSAVEENLSQALAAYDGFEKYTGCVQPDSAGAAEMDEDPAWIDFPFEPARISAPDIHAGGTSVEVRTGLWRTLRPVLDRDRCRKCTWVCSTLCPDGAIHVAADGYPEIDLDHCKGCLICVAVCAPHALTAIPEKSAEVPT